MNINNLMDDMSMRNPKRIILIKDSNGDFVPLENIVEVKYDRKNKDIFYNNDSVGEPAIYLGDDV